MHSIVIPHATFFPRICWFSRSPGHSGLDRVENGQKKKKIYCVRFSQKNNQNGGLKLPYGKVNARKHSILRTDCETGQNFLNLNK